MFYIIFYSRNFISVAYTLTLKINIWILDIGFTCLFYYLIFKIKLYIHHYLSIILIISTGIIIDLVFKYLQNAIIDNWFLILLRLIREILCSLIDIIKKYIIDRTFCSIYELIFYNGIYLLSLLGIFSIFNYFFFQLDNFGEYFEKYNYIELLVSIGVMIAQLTLELCTLFTNKNNSPCHIFIITVFGQLFVYIIDFDKNYTVIIICLLFILFVTLVFNEIIELNFLGLSKNTKRNIIAFSKLWFKQVRNMKLKKQSFVQRMKN